MERLGVWNISGALLCGVPTQNACFRDRLYDLGLKSSVSSHFHFRRSFLSSSINQYRTCLVSRKWMKAPLTETSALVPLPYGGEHHITVFQNPVMLSPWSVWCTNRHKICSMHRHTGTPTWHWECLSDKTCDEPMCQDNAITCMKRWGTFLHEQERKSYLSHLKFNRLRTWLKQKITLSCKSLLINSL